MKTGPAIILGAVAVAAIAAGVYMIDIEQTEQAALPDVDVSVEGGNLPEFEAEVGEIAVTEETVTVPDVDVEVSVNESEVSVPSISVTPPSNDG
ncbi:hypothetical protein C8N43_3610 [Litoreibacter ponti]|uniref:Uncharacterized protein n=1 Tax=Litoreibacter ponti TaxID=1510457 RepID=A0A2T6BFG6_9RHOB|nr:hypothetical protein [Litoreibacter ponti]PTX54789.1 hypothetical protein C8N43_3610 [Litoreibacter ponti]